MVEKVMEVEVKVYISEEVVVEVLVHYIIIYQLEVVEVV
jgi:hypothetical protein